jgi:hypothetical protein
MTKNDIARILAHILVVVAMLFLLAIILNVAPRKQVVIDCRIAEISPDIPVRAKEECRKLNIQRN